MKVTDIKKGDKVHFKADQFAKPENGIVKEVPENQKRWARVVFKCADDWDNYENYTAALTDVSNLHEGWV